MVRLAEFDSAKGIENEKQRIAARKDKILADLQARDLVPLDSISDYLRGKVTMDLSAKALKALSGGKIDRIRDEAIHSSAVEIAKIRGDNLELGVFNGVRPYTEDKMKKYMDYLEGVIAEHDKANNKAATEATAPNEPAGTKFRDMVSQDRGSNYRG